MGKAVLLGLLVALGAQAQEEEEPAVSGPFAYTFSFPSQQEVASGQITVHVDTASGAPGMGYFPMRVMLSSAAPTAQEVQLSFSSGSSSRPITRTVTLGAGERRTVFLPVPTAHGYGQLQARAPGITGGGRRSVYFSPSRPPDRVVLAVGSADQFQKLIELEPSHEGAPVTVVKLAAQEAPEELSAYLGFDAVVLTDLPPDELTEGRRRALEAYAATGGTLVVGRFSRALSTYFPLLQKSAPGLHPYGFGFIHLCEAQCGPGLQAAVGLMQPAVQPSGSSPEWARRRGPERGMMLPQASAPVGRFLVIILLFTLAIGPGSAFIARRKGSASLLITIPATAAVTCLALVGYSVLKEGFRVHASTRGYTLLDRVRGRAITVGLGAYYANLSPGAARFGSTVGLVPPGPDFNPQLVSIDWTQGARFGSDFLPSRAYREWGVLAVEPSRARLVVRRSGERVEVQNALGSDIESAHFRFEGEYWEVGELRDGQAGQAKPRSMVMPLPQLAGREFADRFHDRIPTLTRRELREGEFLAQVEGSSFLPLGGLRLTFHDAHHLVRGEVDR